MRKNVHEGTPSKIAKLTELYGFNFNEKPRLVFNILMLYDVQRLSFWLIFIYICDVSTILKKLILDHLEVTSEKAKFTTETPRAKTQKT